MACRGGRLCHYSVSRRYRAGLGVPMPTCRRAIAQGASECVRWRWGWWGAMSAQRATSPQARPPTVPATFS